MKIKRLIYLIITALTLILTGSACESTLGPDVNTQTPEEQIVHAPTGQPSVRAGQYREPNDTDLFFNPQPEPPAQIFSFETVGLPGHNWEGRFEGTKFNGRISVETLSSIRRGKTLHVVQLWTLFPPDPILPVRITLKGILNMANGKIVMNGMAENDEDHTNVHLRGVFVETAEQGISAGGELMFNPQPEPPARR